jgi:sulfotransferase
VIPRLHFLSGLPRSGSTLLAAILRQNPRFHAGMSGPLAGMFNALLGEMSGKNEFSVFITDAQRQRVLQGLFENFYADCTADVIFDTNRAWCTRLPALRTLFPQSRVIACVREVSWIIDSIERLVRKNAFQPSSIFNYLPGGTVYTRANGLASSEGMVGFAYDALKEAFYGGEAQGRLMLVQYETLTTDPEKVLQAIYAFLEEPVFAHDFAHVTFDAKTFDEKSGTPGLHTVHPEVRAIPRTTILPPDLFQRFAHDAFWQNPQHNPNGIAIV